MKFTETEKERLKEMLLYLIKQKEKQSGGHNGFTLFDLRPIIQKLEEEGKIKSRKAKSGVRYFINKNLKQWKQKKFT